MKPTRLIASTLIVGALSAGCGSSSSTDHTTGATSTKRPTAATPLSAADTNFLEQVALDSIQACGDIGISAVTGETAKADRARAKLAATADKLIALYKRVDPDAPVPIVPAHPVSARKVTQDFIEQLNEHPPAPPDAPACAPELAQRITSATGIS